MISEDTRERLLSEDKDFPHEDFEENLEEIQESKERYYNSILEGRYFDISPKDYLVCRLCKEKFYYITTKSQLIGLLTEKVDDTKPFALEMIRFHYNSYIQGDGSISFDSNKNLCSHCVLYSKTNKTWLSKLKNIFNKNSTTRKVMYNEIEERVIFWNSDLNPEYNIPQYRDLLMAACIKEEDDGVVIDFSHHSYKELKKIAMKMKEKRDKKKCSSE